MIRQGLPTAELVHSFTEEFLAKSFDERVPIPDFHDMFWEDLCNPDERYVAIAAPRG